VVEKHIQHLVVIIKKIYMDNIRVLVEIHLVQMKIALMNTMNMNLMMMITLINLINLVNVIDVEEKVIMHLIVMLNLILLVIIYINNGYMFQLHNHKHSFGLTRLTHVFGFRSKILTS